MNAATFFPCHSSGITGSGGADVRLTIAGDLVGRGGRPLAEHLQQVAVGVGRVEDRPGVDQRADRMELELELRHDAEVAASAAQPPEQVGVLGLARVDEPAVGGDDVGADEVVAGEAVLAHQPADAAAEREAADAGRRDETARRREAVRLGLVVDVGPDRTAADGRPARIGIDAHAVHRREVDHDPVVAGREPGDAVAAAAHGDREVVAAREADRGDHVRRAGATDDERRPPAVVGAVPHQARLGVAVVSRVRISPRTASRSSCTVASPRTGAIVWLMSFFLSVWLCGKSYPAPLCPDLAGA